MTLALRHVTHRHVLLALRLEPLRLHPVEFLRPLLQPPPLHLQPEEPEVLLPPLRRRDAHGGAVGEGRAHGDRLALRGEAGVVPAEKRGSRPLSGGCVAA